MANTRPVLGLTVAFTVGILVAGVVAVSLPFLYACLLAVLAVWIWLLCYRGQPWLGPLLAAFFLAGMIRFVQVDALSPWDISGWVGQTVHVHGRVTDNPRVLPLTGDDVQVIYAVAADSVEVEGQPAQIATGGLLLSVRQRETMTLARYGDYVAAQGLLTAPHGFNNPGAVDYAASLRRQGITARMTVKDSKDIAVERHNGAGVWRRWLFSLRQHMTEAAGTAMPPAEAAVLQGMVFGGYSGIPQNVVKAFAATGIVHILSVSGTHVALVAGVVMWLGARVGVSVVYSAAAAVVAVILYGLLSGLTPPVIRSIIMGCTALGALVVRREGDALTALAVAALAMLVYEPRWVYDISFQLSFGATAGLVTLYRPVTAALAQMMPPWLASALATTAAAQLGVLPFLGYYFASFSLVSFVANIVVVPVVEAAVVLGLAAGVSGLVHPWLGGGLNLLCGLLLKLVLLLTDWFAAWPGATVYLPAGNFLTGTMYYGVLAWSAGYHPGWLPGPLALWRIRPGWCAAGVLLLAAGIFLLTIIPRPLTVHFLDVGQGDACVVVTPHGRVVMIDTGGGGDNFDIGDRVVVPYLRHIGVRHIDYLFLTHGHTDHAGGAAAVVATLPVDNVVMAREPFASPLVRAVRSAGSAIFIPAYTGQNIYLDGAHIRVVYSETNPRASNESSVVIQVKFGEHGYLFTGDMSAWEEERVLMQGAALASTVLKVAHHGARTSTSTAFLQAVRPDYAVIQAGYRNPFGHPHEETLSRLIGQGVVVFRTDRDGAVVFQDDGLSLTIKKTVP